ncbi:Sorting and assembly machinery component 50 -like protein Alike, partial [Caligus rogercresseyi]
FLPLIQGLSLGVGMSMGRLATPTTELPEDQHYFSKNNVTSLDRFGNGFAHRGLGSYLGSDSFWAVSSKLIASLPFIRQSWILDNIKAHCFLDVAGDTSMMGLFGRSRELRASAGFGFAFKILNFGRGELNYSVPLRAHSGDRVVHGVQFGLGLDFL